MQLVNAIVSIAAFLASGAAAHGAVTSYIIAGTTYPGYQGYSPANGPPTIQRQWPSYDPILSVTDAKMRCNGGTSAPLNATIAAGTNITAVWSQWTHSQGPVMVWLYKCAGAFSACDGSGSGWFKIDQYGMTAPPLSGTNWGTDIVVKTLKWSSKIPASITPGAYLIRHELLALHQANNPQFYPECAQIVITGSGSSSPGSTYLTPIPAYAQQSDPGVTVNTIDPTIKTYTCPGPPVWTG